MRQEQAVKSLVKFYVNFVLYFDKKCPALKFFAWLATWREINTERTEHRTKSNISKVDHNSGNISVNTA